MSTRKTIAGIELVIDAPPGINLLEPSAVSKAFLAPAGGGPACDHCIRIELSDTAGPDASQAQRLFCDNATWSYHRDADSCWIVFHPAASTAPRWKARFNHEFSRGTVFCRGLADRPAADTAALPNPVSYPLDQLVITHFMSGIGGMLVHAAGLVHAGAGFIFPGRSGAGKSTLSKLFMHAAGARLLSDDRIILRRLAGGYRMYGTPWPGETGHALNESAPLNGIFFLTKAGKTLIRPLKPAEALPRLLPVVSIPWYDRDRVEHMSALCDDLLGNVPLFELAFVPEPAAADQLMEFARALCPKPS